MMEQEVLEKKRISFYDLEDEYFEFSNFFPRTIKVEGLSWPSSEHYYQAQKFENFVDREEIRKSKTPKGAFLLGRNSKGKRISHWDDVKKNIMDKVIYEKFTQHEDLKMLLLSTNNIDIQEKSETDYYWGMGKDGTGKNVLGVLIMELRKRLKKVEEAKARAKEKWMCIQENVNIPTDYGNLRFNIYMDHKGKEHLAIISGKIDTNEPVLTRIHSECMTGDVFKSQKCDCGAQLDKALKAIVEAAENGKGGIVLYMRDEGRGIGLGNKLRAYKYQEEGFDTIEANEIIKLPVDARNYELPANILKNLGVFNVKLITNNPLKISGLIHEGIHVERITFTSPVNEFNAGYLNVKKSRMGHKINL